MLSESRCENRCPVTGDLIGKTIMHILGRHQCDTAVPMLFVIPAKEVLAEGPAILDGAEPLRELRTVLERPELGCRIWVVVTDMRATVGFCHTQVSQQQSNGF